ncbi:MAG: cysteine desulfurase [bacterium]|nr:cysteine desulfurase [bacterium]
MKRIFLDYASTTPVDKKVLKAMLPYMKYDFGNPSALYKEGVLAKVAISDARKKIAELLAIRPEEMVFTASGTEADNLALIGTVEAWKDGFVPHIITTTIEHPGILEVCKHLEKNGCEVTYVPVEENGIVDPQKIKSALKENTVLVSIMYANNEIGTIQPIRDIARIVQEYKKSHPSKLALPYLHTDASQAANYLDVSFQRLGVDMMTLDASKFYGPKGVGLLASKRYVNIKPLILGGGQEKGLRAGTENVPGIVGFAHALVLAEQMKEKEIQRLQELQELFISHVIKYYPDVFIQGDIQKRLPNNVNIAKLGLDSEFAVIKLDHAGISCSSASSCMNLSEESYSYVINALGERGRASRSSSLRFTFGRKTTRKEIKLTLNKIRSILITQ